jgi:hypothetical protein
LTVSSRPGAYDRSIYRSILAACGGTIAVGGVTATCDA